MNNERRIGRVGKAMVTIGAVCCCAMYGQTQVEATNLWDVQDHWAKPYVEYMEQRGAIKGYEDGSFQPENEITYGEAIKLIVATFDNTITNHEGGHWATNYLYSAEQNKIVKKGQYKAEMLDRPALRKEIMYMISESLTNLAYKPVIELEYEMKWFSDANESINENGIDYYKAIKTCYLLGIVEGDDKGLMKPEMPITRAEMVTILSRAYSEEWRKYKVTEKKELQVSLPNNVTEYNKVWAYMPNSFYEAGNTSWAKYAIGGYPAIYLDAYVRETSTGAMRAAAGRIEKGMSALLNVSYKMSEEEWKEWKENMKIFIDPAEQKERYIEYVKKNKIEIRGGVVVNPCTIGTMYTNEKEGKSSLGIKGIIEYKIMSNPNKEKQIRYDQFLNLGIKEQEDNYVVIYLSTIDNVRALYNVSIDLRKNI